MRILLVSEGKHEESGALEALVRRVATKVTHCTWQRISCNEVGHVHGKGKGFFKRALCWMQHAQKEGFDGLVLVTDADLRDYRAREQELNEAQEFEGFLDKFPRALGIAIRSFDAWMLADEAALSSVLEIQVEKQSSPEDQRHPKDACQALLDQSGCRLWPRDLYKMVAQQLDIALLEQRCPKGFGIFAHRLRSL